MEQPITPPPTTTASAEPRLMLGCYRLVSTSWVVISDGPGPEAWSLTPEEGTMPPIVLFGIQFTFSLVAYALIAWWYVAPRLSRLPREVALVPLVWIHAFRIVGGTILAPAAVDAAVPSDFRTMIGYGDMATAVVALLAFIAFRRRVPRNAGGGGVCRGRDSQTDAWARW